MKKLVFATLLLCSASALPAAAQPTDAAPKPPVTWSTIQNTSVVNPTEVTTHGGWEPYKNYKPAPSVDQKLEDPILKGAIDVHSHFGPDAYGRQWDAFEIAKIEQSRGMRGAVFKNHWAESAGLAYMIRKYAAPGFEAFGGLALNTPEGGVNPEAVRYFAEVEGHYAKIVWMPTHDSEFEVKYLKEGRPYVRVSKDGVLLPEVLQVLDLIAQYKLTLATGHVSPKEMLQIVDEAKKRGIDRMIITHPDLGPQFTNPTTEELKKAVADGAYAEIVATSLNGKNPQPFIDMIKTLGPAHCIISTDSGLVGTPNHADALVLAARVLRKAKFSEADLNLMFKKNPAVVLGLPVLP
jgi:hypothetical protein